MSTSFDVDGLARRVLTEREHHALVLSTRGLSYRAIAVMMGVGVSTSFETVKRAERKLAAALREAKPTRRFHAS